MMSQLTLEMLLGMALLVGSVLARDSGSRPGRGHHAHPDSSGSQASVAADHVFRTENKTGIVDVFTSLNVRTGPGLEYRIVGGLKPGRQVTILGEQDGWYQIEWSPVPRWVYAYYVWTEGKSVRNQAIASAQPSTGGSLTDPLDASFLPSGSTTSAGGTSASGSGSAADNIKALANAGIVNQGSFSNNGQITFTQYGGGSDRTPDQWTQAGLGNRGNTLRATSLALSPNLIREYGLKGGEEISVRVNGQTYFLGHYDDTTGSQSRNNVIDVYDPNDSLGNDSFCASIQAGQWELVIGDRSV